MTRLRGRFARHRRTTEVVGIRADTNVYGPLILLFGGRRSASGPVGIRPVREVVDGDRVRIGVDRIDDAVVATSGAVEPLELEQQRVPYPGRVGGEPSVAELYDRRGDLLRQSAQRPLR
jgi:hypothetical protein